ncbi:MAG: leucyl aminopeptidase [Anaerolineae bacterium]|nr:leucyl aminopeptidase [Anaerolineae bacterium]
MRIEAQTGSLEKTAADAVVVNVFQDVAPLGGATGAVDRALGGGIMAAVDSGDFKGKVGECMLFYSGGKVAAPRVLLVGIGKQEAFTLDCVRRAAAAAAKKAQELGLKHIASVVHGAGAGQLDPVKATSAVVEGTLLGTYRFDDYKSGHPPRPALEQLTLVELDDQKVDLIRTGVRMGEAIAAGVNRARDLVNQPPNFLTPTAFAEAAQAVVAGRPSLRLTIIDRDEMQRLGMGALLGVAQGSVEPPKLIVLDYGPQAEAPVVLVGKGITFDTGGISIKPAMRMELMKGDMAGGAAVLGAMQAVADLALPLRVVGIIAATENMPSGNAIKPADVLKAMNGKTIEIISTDAEGRLVLADALGYAQTLTPRPQAMVDLATLTGAVFMALGRGAAGLFSNNDMLAERLAAAGERSYERVWRLPLYREYRDVLDSDVADLKNSAGVSPAPAGASVGAIFIQEFVDAGIPWAHLDVASMTYHTAPTALGPQGATGYGVRLLVELLQEWEPFGEE